MTAISARAGEVTAVSVLDVMRPRLAAGRPWSNVHLVPVDAGATGRTAVERPPAGTQAQAAEPSDLEDDFGAVAVLVAPEPLGEPGDDEDFDEEESDDELPESLDGVEPLPEPLPESLPESLPELLPELLPEFLPEPLRESLL